MADTYYAWDPEFDCITKETDATGAAGDILSPAALTSENYVIDKMPAAVGRGDAADSAMA